MPKVLVRVRVLPTDTSVNLKELLGRISEGLRGVADVIRAAEEPIAFGLSALIVDLVMEEREGGTYDVEQVLTSIEGVSQIDVIGVSLISGS